jgi:hypothetical protein
MLSHNTLEKIQQRFGLVEVGRPYRVIESQIPPGGPVGEMRVWRGEKVRKLVYVGISVPMMQLDSHMIFAFTPPESPVPHFTLDSVLAGPTFAFHLDLIPRLDLGVNLAYMDAVFGDLTAVYESTRKTEGLSEARLSPRQYAIMSPWMLVHRATEAAYQAIEPAVDFYRDHWAGLVENGLPEDTLNGITPEQLAERDRLNRALIFNPAVDPVWNQLKPLIGEAMGAEMRGVLSGQ